MDVIAEAAGRDASTRGAVRFFWVWLALATGVSVGGNVAHAVLTAPSGTVRLAAAAAVVPPAVLLGSTHSVALLVKTRRLGFSYWCALAMTIVLAGCAFVLSFDALRDLAVSLGMPPGRAWLWPVAIDVSIANSTLSLLSLTPRRAVGAAPVVNPDAEQRWDRPARRTAARPASTGQTAAVPAPAPVRGGESGCSTKLRESADPLGDAMSAVPRSASVLPVSAAPVGAMSESDDRSTHYRWRPAADELVRSGVTSKDPAVVAAVLAEHAAGTLPGTISRRHKVHHSTVGRILAGAEALTG